jgi:hypothetical protein
MSTLKSQLEELAQGFATSVLQAIRSASLQDLVAAGGGSEAGNGRRSAVRGPARDGGGQPDPLRLPRPSKGGRLARRSPADIEKALASVVSLVKRKKDGLRSEEIQAALKLDKRELPRVLRTGVAKRALKAKGQKRATRYLAA